MFIRRVKRKCNIRGCKSTDCFAISRTREVGNTVIICKSCLDEALRAIDEMNPETKSNIPAVDNASYPPLFFNSKALGTETQTDGITSVPYGNEQSETELLQSADSPDGHIAEDYADADSITFSENVTSFKCPDCGRNFDSEKGLKTHLRSCKAKNNGE